MRNGRGRPRPAVIELFQRGFCGLVSQLPFLCKTKVMLRTRLDP